MRAVDADWILTHLKPYELSDEEWSVTGGTALRLIHKAIENAPTLEVQPIIHARWRFDGFYFHCSNCGCEALSKKSGVIGNIYLTDYCPNCGAKMKRPGDEVRLCL